VSAPASGRVFDLGFRRYEGQRQGRRRAVRAVYKDGLRTAMGLGRGGRAKILPWLFIAAAIIPALVFALIAGAVDRLAADFSEDLDLPSHADYYSIAGIVLFVFAAVVGPELFCPDRSDGTISLYLVRPLRATDYAIARWAALATVMVLIAWLPQLVLLAGLVLGAPDPGSYLGDHWSDIPRFLIAGVVIAIYVSTITAMAAAFAKRRAYAAAFLVGLLILSAAVIGGLTDTLSDSAGRWVALLSVGDVPLYVNDVIFGEQTSNIEAAADLSNVVQVGWYVIIIAAAGAIFLGRYRRLSL
jgi:ABC-2 type transport system permease protein